MFLRKCDLKCDADELRTLSKVADIIGRKMHQKVVDRFTTEGRVCLDCFARGIHEKTSFPFRISRAFVLFIRRVQSVLSQVEEALN